MDPLQDTCLGSPPPTLNRSHKTSEESINQLSNTLCSSLQRHRAALRTDEHRRGLRNGLHGVGEGSPLETWIQLGEPVQTSFPPTVQLGEQLQWAPVQSEPLMPYMETETQHGTASRRESSHEPSSDLFSYPSEHALP